MHHIKSILFVHIIILMASCSLQTDLANVESRSFYIENRALNEGILRIHLPKASPKNMAIRTPNGEWFIVQDKEQSIIAIPQKQFETANKLEFKTSELVGVIWRESIKFTELIFKKSGNYLIYFADNLETEPENTFSLQLKIHFRK